MRLRNEGVIQPAPVLRGKAQEVSLEVQRWDGMQAVTHWQLGNPENEYMQELPESVQQMVGSVYQMLTTAAAQQRAM